MNEIIFRRKDNIEMIIQKDLIGVGKDYVVFEMTDEQTMQLGKLAMDIANSTEIKELSLKLEN
jgi:hypothetical protein